MCESPTERPKITARINYYTAPQLARSVIRRVRTFLFSDTTSHTVHVVNTACSPWAGMFCLISRHARVHDLCSVFCTCLDHSYVKFTVSYKRWCTGSFLNVYYHSYCSIHGIHTCCVCEYACLVSGTKIPAVRDRVRAG